MILRCKTNTATSVKWKLLNIYMLSSWYEWCGMFTVITCWGLFLNIVLIIFVSIDSGKEETFACTRMKPSRRTRGIPIQMPSGYAAASFIDGLWIGLDWSKVYGEGWGSTAFSRLLTPHFTTTAILGLNTNSEQFINILLFCRSLWITMSSYCQGFHLKTIGRLKIHVETHIDDKSFKCSQCQYVSKQTGHMFC